MLLKVSFAPRAFSLGAYPTAKIPITPVMHAFTSSRIATAHPGGRAEHRVESGTLSDDEWIGLEGGAVRPNGRERENFGPPARARLTGDDLQYLHAVLAHELATNTKASYQSQWRRFAA